mmetsp:Transcript_2294/g.4007  ORF Transcript_2294/g.4007 Transcript_2294/m.4007 type:complete len:231 (-) Transcript_2294:1268-1960(-)
MRKWERNVHDLPRHVVMHHPVAQELHQPTDDRRVHLPQTPVQVLSYYELLEPPQGHVGLGLRSPRLLQESNFGIRHAPEDEQRPSGVVFGSVFGQPIVSHPVTKYREEVPAVLEHIADVAGQIVGVDGGPRRAGKVDVQHRLAAVDVISERGQGHGARQRRNMRQLLEEEGRRQAVWPACKVLIGALRGWKVFGVEHRALQHFGRGQIRGGRNDVPKPVENTAGKAELFG